MQLKVPRPSYPPGELALLGDTTFRGVTRRVGLLPKDRLRHMYVLGKTGAGKSTLLEHLIARDLEQGADVVVLDPHGDLIEALLPHVPARRADDVVLFPGPLERPVTWNLFRGKAPPDQLVSAIISVMKREWRDSWGPRLEHILRNGLLAVAPHPRASLLLLRRFLGDEGFREKALRFVEDPIVRAFWTLEWPSYGKALQAEALSPIANKLGAITTHPILRATLGSAGSKLNLDDHLRGNRILFANLSTATLGEDGTHLLGRLLLSAILLAGARRPRNSAATYIYLDEAQYFVGSSVGTILAEARKYGLGLILAHQYLEQLDDEVRAGIIGNVGTKCLFRVGSRDASILAPEVEPEYTAHDLATLPAYHFVGKLLAHGLETRPISIASLPPRPRPPDATTTIATIRRLSAERYGTTRERLERSAADAIGVHTPTEPPQPL